MEDDRPAHEIQHPVAPYQKGKNRSNGLWGVFSGTDPNLLGVHSMANGMGQNKLGSEERGTATVENDGVAPSMCTYWEGLEGGRGWGG